MAASPTVFAGLCDMLWQAQLPVFGRVVEYWPDDDSSQALEITVIWVEGNEEEYVSPGRYWHMRVRHSDLLRPPLKGDSEAKDDVQYGVVAVDDFGIGYSRLTLQDRTEDF